MFCSQFNPFPFRQFFSPKITFFREAELDSALHADSGAPDMMESVAETLLTHPDALRRYSSSFKNCPYYSVIFINPPRIANIHRFRIALLLNSVTPTHLSLSTLDSGSRWFAVTIMTALLSAPLPSVLAARKGVLF